MHTNHKVKEECSSIAGVLCGACRPRFGFSVLLNRCVRCNLVNLLWIAGLGQCNYYQFVLYTLTITTIPLCVQC